jgi:hypothetical protein
MGKVYPCLPNTTLELRPNNAKYPSYYIHEPNIKAVFALQKGNAENQQKV